MDQPKKVSKQTLKKQQQYQERRQRLMNQGVEEKNVDQLIAQQDYSALPVEKKLQRLESILAQSFGQIGNDIEALRHNDMMIADAMDINMRSMSACLAKAGIPLEEQKAIIEDVQKEMAEEHRARAEAERKKQEEAELKNIQAAVSEETQGEDPVPAVPVEATVFGG